GPELHLNRFRSRLHRHPGMQFIEERNRNLPSNHSVVVRQRLPAQPSKECPQPQCGMGRSLLFDRNDAAKHASLAGSERTEPFVQPPRSSKEVDNRDGVGTRPAQRAYSTYAWM